MKNLLALVGVIAAGCTTENTIVGNEQTLAELDAELVLTKRAATSTDPEDLVLHIVDPRCVSVAGNVSADMDGVLGWFERDGLSTSGHEDFGHGYEEPCQYPRVSWHTYDATEEFVTFELRDPQTTWTMVVAEPARPRTFFGAEAGTVHPGEAVTLTMYPASGEIDAANTHIVLKTASESVTIDLANAHLQVTATELRFIMPQLTSSGEATLTISGRVDHAILDCFGPKACKSSDALAQTIAFTLAN